MKGIALKMTALPWLSVAASLTMLLLASCGGNAGGVLPGTGTDCPTSVTGTGTGAESRTEAVSRADTGTVPTPETDTSAAEPETQSDPRTAEEILWDSLAGDGFLRGRGRRVAGLAAPDDCPTPQGGWFDGRYWYQLFIGKDTEHNERDNTVRLVRYDTQTGKTVRISDPLPLNHANDLTYNSRRGLLVAVHNNPNRKLVSFIDPETLTVTETVTLPCRIYSLAYSPERDMYVAGIAGGQSFCLLDAAFRQVGGPFSPTPDTAGYITQGCACDARYIYFVLYRQNVITVYDWEGRHIRTLSITVSGEPENLSQVGGSLYVASAAGGAQLTRIELRNR